MMLNIKSVMAVALGCLLSVAVQAEDVQQEGDQHRYQNRHNIQDYDRKGDRINYRMDRKGDRINNRLDKRAERAELNGNDKLAQHLDRKGNRIESRFQHRGDRINRRMDRVSNRR